MTDKEFLEESLTKGLIEILMDEWELSLPEALAALSGSATFARVLDEETGLYRESPAYVFEMLTEELAR